MKEVFFVLSKETTQCFAGLKKQLEREGIEAKERTDADFSAEYLAENAFRREGTLYITDKEFILKKLLAYELPTAVFLHEGNRKQNLSGAQYAFEQPEDLDVEYLERVYRRYAGIPWEILRTKRCILRESRTEDVDAFYELYKEPEITRYTDGLYEYKSSERAALQEYIDKVYPYYEFGIWTVILKETGKIIGRAGFNIREGCELPELGYVIGLPWQGKGLATEVCQAILSYGAEELGFTQVQAVIHRDNRASLRLAEGLGFQEWDCELPEKKEYVFLVWKGEKR